MSTDRFPQRARNILALVFIGTCLAMVGHAAEKRAAPRKRFLVVSSYHREYEWSRETNEGFCTAMMKFGYIENKEQADEYTRNDYVETSRAVIRKVWMNSKVKSAKGEKEDAGTSVYRTARSFKPDLIFLGDDEAAEFAGTKFLDSHIPVVFWGVNNTPVKYGLVDSANRPGHNVTGVYQAGYYAESLTLLKTIAPNIRTFATLSVETAGGRSHYKAIQYLARKGALPLQLVETVATNDYELWKKRVLELQGKVDAFFLANYAGMVDRKGNFVPPEEVARWYLKNIRIPEAVELRQFVTHGMLCGVDDSGYNQGFQAAEIARDILEKGANPATYPPRSPKHGAQMVNRERAGMLGIRLRNDMGIEEYVEKASVMKE